MATELVGIELELRGEEGVFRDMQKLDTMIRRLGGRHKVEFELGKAKQRVLELTGEINETNEAIDKTRAKIRDLNAAFRGLKEGDEGFEDLKEAIKEANQELDDQRDHLKSSRNELKNVRQEVNELSNALGRVKPLGRVFSDMSLKVARFGSALQSMGNALTRFSAPVRMLMGGAVLGAGYNILGKATEGLKSGFSRYDTMKKYTRLMQEYSTESYNAEQSIQDLDKSVLGLPIALDDAVSLAQRYTLSLGDMERGTQLAIATNNAFLASMATENQRYQGMLQMQDLLNGKKLNSREWMSLGASMGKAINEIGKEFGYTNENMGEFRQELYAGHISTKDFLDALQKVGTGNGSLVKLAEESKNTWEAFFSRIGTAFSRVGYNALLSMDKLVETATKGKWTSLNSLLDDKIIPSIDNLKDSIVSWIDANPDKIIDFFNSVKSIDWKGIVTGFAQGMADIANYIKMFADATSKINLSWLGKIFAKSGALGWMVTITGGLLKGTRHFWAGLGTVITALTRHFTAGKIKGGIFGKIMSIFGKKKDIQAAGDAAKEIPTVTSTFRSAFKSLENLLKVGGAVVIAGGTAWFASTAVKGVLNDLKDIGNLISSGDIDWASAGKAMAGFAGYLSAFVGVAYVIGDIAKLTGGTGGLTTLKSEAILGAITALALGIADLDMFFIKDMLKKFRDITEYLGESIDNLRHLKNLNMGMVTSRIKNTISVISQVYSALKIQDAEGKSLMAASTTEINAMKDIIGGMASVLGSIGSINESMKTLSSTDLIGEKDAKLVGEKVGGILEGLGEAFHSYIETDFGYNPADATAGISTTITNFNTALKSLIGSDGLFASMRKVLNDLRDIPGVQSINNVMSSVKSWMVGEGGLFSNLKEIVKGTAEMGNTEDVASKMSNFASAFESIRIVFKKLKSIKKLTGNFSGGDIPGMGAVRNLLAQLETTFDTERVNRINSQIESFLEQINGLFDAIDTINKEDGKINIEIHLTDTIIGKDTVLRHISQLALDIQAALNKIPTYYRKDISIDVIGNAKFRQSGDGWTRLGGSDGTLRASGGMIYRSKGGGIGFPGRPRGTDRVPVWATAGEYIHNKRAVSAFGIDFMRKVNNLDMKGAMSELMHRAGHMANINRGATITNNNYNNQKVVINNSNAGAGYTFKSASRFVGAF